MAKLPANNDRWGYGSYGAFGPILNVITWRVMKATVTLSALLIGIFSAVSVANAQQPAVSQQASSAERQPTPSSPSAGKALIYVYRVGSIVGAAGYDRIFVNTDYLGALHNSDYAQHEVPPGTVIFSTLSRLNSTFIGQAELMKLQKQAKEKLRIEVEAGKTYYIKWSVGGKMKLVDATIGAKEMKGLHIAKD